MNRKSKACLVVAAVLAVALAPQATAKAPKKAPKKVERVASAPYSAEQQVGVATPAAGVGYVAQEISIPSQSGEKYVTISLEDTTGQNVYFLVSQSPELVTPADSTGYCGTTGDPISIAPGAPVYVWIWQGTCEDGTPAVATKGTVQATFTNVI